MDSTQVSSGTPDFGVFAQLGDYGPLGLAALALGYVSWIFIKRHLTEKDRIKKQLLEIRKKTKK
jgi:hypothetical protein